MSLRQVLEACGAQPRERFQLASIKDKNIRCAAFTYPDECEAGDAWAAAESPRDVYLCGNPMKPDSSGSARMSKDDVAEERLLLLDLDPEKTQDDPRGLAAEKRSLCTKIAQAVATETGAGHVDSGRGQQVWIRHTVDVDRKALLRGLRQKHAQAGIKIDSTWAANHLMRLPGHVNSRTGEVAKIVTVPSQVLDEAAIAALALPEPKDDDDDIGGELPPVDFGPHDPALVRGQIKAVWENQKYCSDRSTRDAILVLECLRAQVSDADACKLLFALPGGKGREDRRGEGYWQSTIRWARKEHEREIKFKQEVAGISSEDALKPWAVDLLAQAEDEDPTLYEDTIKRFKDDKVRIGQLEKLVKQARKKKGLDPRTKFDGLRNAKQEGTSIGWWHKDEDGWVRHSFGEIKTIMEGMGLPTAKVVAKLAEDAWTIVNEPFQEEELKGRRWNKDAAKLTHSRSEPGPHPTWDQILRILGRGLDGAVAGSPWCQENGIRTGSSYLLNWIGSLFQRPRTKLPWLFFYGLENVGKSTFWEALSLLLTSGFVIANEAIENKGGFNGELAGALLCVVDDLPIHPKALKKIKPWVTGEFISIHAKGGTPYTIPNRTHWIQTGNETKDCPLRKGDTRMTICQVVAAEGADRMPKAEIIRRCKAEASAFTHTIMSIKLPPEFDRLGVVMLETEDKRDQQRANLTPLERWIEKNYPTCLGMDDEALASKFIDGLGGKDAFEWDTPRVIRELPSRIRSERRLVLEVRKLATKRAVRLRASDVLEKLPQCRGDWSSPEMLGKFLSKPGLPLEMKRVRVRGERVFKVFPPRAATATP